MLESFHVEPVVCEYLINLIKGPTEYSDLLLQNKKDVDILKTQSLTTLNTVMCLSIGTPKNNKFSICSK